MTCMSTIDGHGATTAVTHTSSTRYADSFAPEPKKIPPAPVCAGALKSVWDAHTCMRRGRCGSLMSSSAATLGSVVGPRCMKGPVGEG